ncbi:MAG TPA: 23S rRNA (guanosine(2251)-2'-O)-methyltransferase RlmB [Clostridiales bacterium]|nr:23S rRNA (guanosine(2251)-2'-O)-methyltransferase RlmB [Clostridiales bacterium]HQP70646.1 23S rRNA (guanosine(2251)-2'-O)-methyltransferase RlmB [Clostridiales bacterium]
MTEQINSKNAIIELLEADPKKIAKVVIEKGQKGDKLNRIIELCKANFVRFDLVPAKEGARGEERTGIYAIITSFEYADLNDLDMSIIKCAVILDEIEDPHNLGAIIRSAAASGAEVVIIPDRNAAQVTETVIAVSAGTIYKIRICRVKNIASAIDRLKENGFWITGTDMNGSADYKDYDYTNKAAIVIGNEGKGLRRLVSEKCDDMVRIDLDNGVESLNASVAAALILFEVKRKNG